MNKIILQTVSLKKDYKSTAGTLHVLKGIDLIVYSGEIVVIMGPSGVGKSTLLHIIGGLDLPTNGRVIFNDNDLYKFRNEKLASFRNKHIGFIFQFHHLLPEFSALENVMIPGLIGKQNIENTKKEAAKLLTEMGLENRLTHKPNQLSGGEQQRVAFARALINNPEVILADEPTGNLDKKNSESMFELIIDFNKKYKQTFVIVTHNEMIADRADRHVQMEDGLIINS